ncbi:MAG: hypothetical protein EXX96DRAFT_563488 [Benjaminiella poitrasii]|nr:MAG: hypothetical protein EXX96DRAFT_563488 [Benjaminiella poitrasii]
MKFFSVCVGLLAALSGVYARLEISIPDADSVWISGSPGLVQWNSSATEFGLLCNIQLIDVITTQVALNLTNVSVPCSVNTFTTQPLPTFQNMEYMVRIGETNNASLWSYTQDFRILPDNSTGAGHI